MKSKYIEGTNEKYSIREDGAIISNYKNKKKQIAIINNKVHITINNIRRKRSITLLFFKYFNSFYCRHCNQLIKNSNKPQFICKKCRRKQTDKNRDAHYQRNKDIYKLRKRKHVKTLSLSYVNTLLNCKKCDNISDNIINAKRQQLLLYRQLKNK